MDDAHPQRGPAPGRTWLRLGDRLWELEDSEWEHWVRRGWVPPETLVLSVLWSKGVWRRAGALEVYHLFRPMSPRSPVPPGSPAAQTQPGLEGAARPGDAPSGAEGGARIDPAVASIPATAPWPARGLPSAIWGPGLSVTQVLVLVNLLISAALVWTWRDAYTEHLWLFSGRLKAQLLQGLVPVLFVPLFLHASSGHLLGNMVGLTASGAAVEEFYGRLRTLILYLASGLAGAAFSLLRVKPVLSVGASGAIMGFYGVVLMFLLRYRGRFSERQRWKTTRVYLPMLVLALLPSLFMADLYSHVGGFVAGLVLALVIPPRAERLPRSVEEPAREER